MASLTGAAQPLEGEEEVRQWCAQNGLGRFAEGFIEEGWDSLASLRHMREEHLEACGVQKPGHKSVALAALAELKQASSSQSPVVRLMAG